LANRFEFFDHTADIGVRVRGATLEELFRHAAAALYEVMGEWKKSAPTKQKSVVLEAGSVEDLLHDWLAELLFEFSARGVVYDELEISELSPCCLKATLRGGPVDWEKSEPRAEVKAVTYHQLGVEQRSDGSWEATVIFDV